MTQQSVEGSPFLSCRTSHCTHCNELTGAVHADQQGLGWHAATGRLWSLHGRCSYSASSSNVSITHLDFLQQPRQAAFLPKKKAPLPL